MWTVGDSGLWQCGVVQAVLRSWVGSVCGRFSASSPTCPSEGCVDQQQQEASVILSRKCCLADSLLQQMFIVQFLGSMAVKTDNTTEVIYEAMRQVLAARAIHNIFRTTESHLMVTSQTLR